jgi:hypothetical protein
MDGAESRAAEREVIKLYKAKVSQAEIQRQLGLGEKRVRSIINRHLGIVPGVSVPGENTLIARDVKEYVCKGCKRKVTRRPCVGCAAIKWRKKHGLPL